MDGQGDFATKVTGWLQQVGDIAIGWLLSPAAWSQFALPAAALIVARMATARLLPRATRMIAPGDTSPVTLEQTFTPCGGRIRVSPFRPVAEPTPVQAPAAAT